MPALVSEQVDEQPITMGQPAQPGRSARATRRTKMFGKVERRSDIPTKGWGAKYGPSKPDPWISKYPAVALIFALAIWSFYVVVGRVCTPMIRQNSTTGLGLATGVGTMIGFVILWLIFVWSYLKILLVGPGFARDHCEIVPPPPAPPPPPEPEFISYRPESAPAHQDTPSTAPLQTGSPVTSTLVTSSQTTTASTVASPHPGPTGIDDAAGPDPSQFAPITNLVSSVIASDASDRPSESSTVTPSSKPPKKGKKVLRDYREIERPVPELQVGPRWCRYCEINKPDRTHHCRHCGTCVLQFDHHCPWIGQCVGHHNHKFFMVFNLQATLFCAYILIFLVISATKMNNLDGQVIGLVAVSALFGLFAGMMYCSHFYLIIKGLTTLDSYKGRDQQEHDNAKLSAEYGTWLHNQEKSKAKKYWREQWGGVNVDERWKWGGYKEMWEGEMGTNWVGWILPVGRAPGDGLHFRSNPRFGPNGEWLQKRDWPKELQTT